MKYDNLKYDNFFLQPSATSQRHYEALRAFHVDGMSLDNASQKFGFKPSYLKKLLHEFNKCMKENSNPFFHEKRPGPRKRFTDEEVIKKIVALRKQNYSIQDIRVVLAAEETKISLDTIDKILKSEGFAPLPKRTRAQRIAVQIPGKISAPESVPLLIQDEKLYTEQNAGALVFLPLIEKLQIIPAIKEAGFPGTSVLSSVSSVLSFLALKLIGNERLCHDTSWNLDRTLGLFAGLNVLPKSGTLSSYSYRVRRSSNRKLLVALSRIFKDNDSEQGDFNLDFKAIPHWGDASVLEKNWSGARSKNMKSILALIVQDPATGFVSYTDAGIKHANENNAVLDFIDFWKEGRGVKPKMLIFDSKLTTYGNLNKLNKDGIKFLTLRRRGKKLIDNIKKIPESSWQDITIESPARKHRNIRINDSLIKLRYYEGPLRQLILTNHGRERPTFMITNDLTTEPKNLVKKYARRWLVEQEIAEQIIFFQLNRPSSSIVVKVDFDLTISLLAHNLYKVFSSRLPGFEHCTAPTIYRNFLENGACLEIKDKEIVVQLKKKTHLPILFESPFMYEATYISWLGLSIRFEAGASS